MNGFGEEQETKKKRNIFLKTAQKPTKKLNEL
jgi:hypothetical protein